MARECIELGSTPADEDCAQVGSENYEERARAECERYIALLRTKFGTEPETARLAIKGFPHDFGRYYEVVCYFDDGNEVATEYAYLLESKAPTTWKDLY